MEDSLSMYEYCRASYNKSDEGKLKDVDEIVGRIASEIRKSPYKIEQSPFIARVYGLLNNSSGKYPCDNKPQIFIFDAYFVIYILSQYMGDHKTKAACDPENKQDAKYLFKENAFSDDCKLKKMISTQLQEIQKIVSEESNMEVANRRSVAYGRSPDSKKKCNDNNKTIDIISSGKCDGESSKKKRIKNHRIKENTSNIEEWHRENKTITDQLSEMQPKVSELLKQMMSFSGEITERYVLQFAECQIDLFNLISDNYEYHVQASERNGNKDYIHAVENYKEFLELIEENLSVFGIEKIESNQGTRFDGGIHEVYGNNDFSPKSTIVKESMRIGFRYKQNIIQKEKIIV